MTTCKNTQVIELLRTGFTADGYVISKGHAKRKAAAKAIIADENAAREIQGTMVDGYDAWGSILILSNPKMIL